MKIEDYTKLLSNIKSLQIAIRTTLSETLILDLEHTFVLLQANMINSFVEDLRIEIVVTEDTEATRKTNIVFDVGGMDNSNVFLRSITPTTDEEEYPISISLKTYSDIGKHIEEFMETSLYSEEETK